MSARRRSPASLPRARDDVRSRPPGRPPRLALAGGLAAALLWGGCAEMPPPRGLASADAASTTPSAAEAKKLAPGAYAQAEKLRREAHRAFEDGRHADAQILSEHAVAAYAHAHALARTARAEETLTTAEGEVAVREKELAGLEADQTRVTAELDALELRIRVLRDAEPVQDSGPAKPEREKARRSAARALALQARLLCGAATLLATSNPKPSSSGAGGAPGPDEELSITTRSLDELDADLEGASVAPIDRAMRLRAACLSVLTRMRRERTPVSASPGAGDALLSELSRAQKFSPSRDDRGVVVTLRGVFQGESLTSSAKSTVTELGRVAAAHKDFPVAVVLHQDRPLKPGEAATWEARGKTLVAALGVPASSVTVAGDALPVVNPAGKERARNVRVEIVFVTPETF